LLGHASAGGYQEPERNRRKASEDIFHGARAYVPGSGHARDRLQCARSAQETLMNYRTLGNRLNVSAIGLGCWPMMSGGNITHGVVNRTELKL
jgi:hypothetical protein